MLAANTQLTVAQVRDILKETAQDWGETGQDIDYGWGRLDAYAAIKRAGGFTTGAPPTVPGHLTFAGNLSVTGAVAEHTFSVTDLTYPVAVTMIMPRWVGTSSPDFDLFVYSPDGAEFMKSTSSSRQEQIAKRPTQTGTYKVVVKSYAGGGDYVIDVSAGIGETRDQPPVVAVDQPAEGTTVSGTVTVKIKATDDVRVTKVEVAIDNGAFQDITGNFDSTYYTYPWQTTGLDNGEHTMTARATDSANQQSSVTRRVIVRNDAPPERRHEVTRMGQVTATTRDATIAINVGETGYVDLTLSWPTRSDLDFFVYAPDGTFIGRGYTLNNPERLRIDTARWGEGAYRIRVNLYKGPDTTFTLSAKGYKLETFTGTVSTATPDFTQDRFMDYTGRGRVTLSWPGSSDLDFYVFDPAGRERARAYTVNNPEQVDVAIDVTGYWRVRVNLYSGRGGPLTLRTYSPDAVLS